MKEVNKVFTSASPLFQNFHEYLGKSKNEIELLLNQNNIQYNTSQQQLLTESLSDGNEDLLYINLDEGTLECEFRNNICAASRIFFNNKETLEEYYNYCNNTYSKAADNTWLIGLDNQQILAVSLLCIHAIFSKLEDIFTIQNEKAESFYFECRTVIIVP